MKFLAVHSRLRRSHWTVLLAMVLAALVGWRLLQTHRTSARVAPGAQALRHAAAFGSGFVVEAPREMMLSQRWPARLVPQQRWVLKAPSDAQVLENHLVPGQDFAKGQLLLRLHDATLAAEHRTNIRKMARLRLQLAGGASGMPEVLRADYNLTRLRTESARLQAEAQMQRGLLDKGLIARVELQQIEQRAQDAAAQAGVAGRELSAARDQAQLAQDDARSELAALQALERVQSAREAALEVRAPFDGRLSWVAPALQQDVKRGSELALLESVEGVAAEMRLVRSAAVERLFAQGAPIGLELRSASAEQEAAASWRLDADTGGTRPATVRGLVGSAAAGGDESTAPSSSALVVVQLELRPWASALPAQWQADMPVDAWVSRQVAVHRVPLRAIRWWQGRSFVYVRSADEPGVWLRREVEGCADGQGGFLVAQGVARGETLELP